MNFEKMNISNQNEDENNKSSEITDPKQGAEELEEVNKKIENAPSQEEREKAIDEATQIEKRLDKLENELGLGTEDAQEVLFQVYKGDMNLHEALKELEEESPELKEAITSEDSEQTNNILTKMAERMKGSKLLKVASVWLLLSIGGLSGLGEIDKANASEEFSKYSEKNIQLLHPELAKNNASSLMIKINSSSSIDSNEKMVWNRVLLKNGLPKPNQTIADYVSSGSLTNNEIETVFKIAEGI